MYLAKDRFGRIGRVTRQMGLNAMIRPSHNVQNFRSNYVSLGSIEQDAQDQRNREAQAAGQARLKQQQNYLAQIKAYQQHQAQSQKAAQMQGMRGPDPMNEKLKRHFRIQMGQTQTQAVANSVQSDFSLTEITADPQSNAKPALNPNADFNMSSLVGNPLTRNGAYGPITDYDVFVSGVEMSNQMVPVNPFDSSSAQINPQTGQKCYSMRDQQRTISGRGEKIVGGTMLGRLNGSNIKSYVSPKYSRGFGDDDDDDGLEPLPPESSAPAPDPSSGGVINDPSAFDENLPGGDPTSSAAPVTGNTTPTASELADGSSSSSGGVLNTLENTLAKDLPGLFKPAAKSTTTTTTVNQSPAAAAFAANLQASTIMTGVPNWAVYAGGALLVGGVFMAFHHHGEAAPQVVYEKAESKKNPRRRRK